MINLNNKLELNIIKTFQLQINIKLLKVLKKIYNIL